MKVGDLTSVVVVDVFHIGEGFAVLVVDINPAGFAVCGLDEQPGVATVARLRCFAGDFLGEDEADAAFRGDFGDGFCAVGGVLKCMLPQTNP